MFFGGKATVLITCDHDNYLMSNVASCHSRKNDFTDTQHFCFEHKFLGHLFPSKFDGTSSLRRASKAQLKTKDKSVAKLKLMHPLREQWLSLHKGHDRQNAYR